MLAAKFDLDVRQVDELSMLSAVASRAAEPALSLSRLPGNPAKIRLIADLANQLTAVEKVRILDVGAGGKYEPFNLWEPFASFANRIELVGVDVAHLDETKARADELQFSVELFKASVGDIVDLFGSNAFDAVVSTQVLEHLPDWPAAIKDMRDVLRPGGRLYITCDSGDKALSPKDHARLVGKRAYARASRSLPLVSRVGGRFFSGDWEEAPRVEELRDVARQVGLVIHELRHYGIRDVKALQNRLEAEGRLRWFELETHLRPGDPARFLLLYLLAVNPAM